MPIELVCSDCSTTYRVKESAAGKNLTCKQCGSVLSVPLAATTEAHVEMTLAFSPSDDEGMLSPEKVDEQNGTSESAGQQLAAAKIPVGKKPLAPGVYLEGIDQGWRLVASTRSAAGVISCCISGIGLFVIGNICVGELLRGPQGNVYPVVYAIVPLLLIAVPLILASFLRRLAGRIEITVVGNRGTVYSGVGSKGPTQHFCWSESLKISDEFTRGRNGEWHEIVLTDSVPVRTGKHLTKEQSTAMLRALRELQPFREGGTESWLVQHFGS